MGVGGETHLTQIKFALGFIANSLRDKKGCP